jgi:transcriptional regulator with XRE-family HTH domain
MDAVASISDKVGDLGGYLREQREHARLSVRQLATLAGVSNPYLSQVERGLRNPSAEVLQQIAKGLRISAEALYVRAGILEDAQRPGVEDAVTADAVLTDRQKRVLLDIYAAFLTENARAARDAEQAEEPVPARRQARARVAAKRAAAKAASTDKPGRAEKRGAERRAGRRRSSTATAEAVQAAVEAALEPDTPPDEVTAKPPSSTRSKLVRTATGGPTRAKKPTPTDAAAPVRAPRTSRRRTATTEPTTTEPTTDPTTELTTTTNTDTARKAR